jgi:hypothetical protein
MKVRVELMTAENTVPLSGVMSEKSRSDFIYWK